MASNNEAKIRFAAETADFNQAIKEANSEMSTLRAEMKLADAQFTNTGDAAEYQQQKLELLEQALEANHDKQEALTQKLETAKGIYGEDSDEVAKLERQLIYAQTEEEKLKTQVDDTNQGLTDQSGAADQAGESVSDMASLLVNSAIADTVKDIADAAVDLAENFDEANAVIAEGTGASGDALDGLNTSAQNAFGTIRDANQDLQGIAGILAELNTRFGLTGKDAEDMTTKIANFAQHTGTDGVKAVDDIANIMQRWGLDIGDADNLLDDLTTANQSCQLSVDDLSKYLADNSIQFGELGYSTEDALAMLVSLSDGGADVGKVMSGLKKGVSNLSAETDDVPGAFQGAIDAIADCDSVSEALQTQVGDTGKTVEQIFGKSAAQELAGNILNGNMALDEWKTALENNDGALESVTENATTMEDAWSQATNNVSMALGTAFAPVISDVVTKVSEFVTTAAQMVQDSPALQAVVVGLGTAFGILAAALAIGAVITGVTTAFGALAGVLGVISSPIFLVVGAIAALVAGLVYAYKNSETFRNIVNKAFETVKTFIITAVTTIKEGVVNAFTTIKDKVSSIITAVKNIVSKVWNGIKSVTSSAWNGIKSAVSNAITGAKTTVSNVVTTVKTKVSGVWDAIKRVTSSAWNVVKTAVTTPITAAKNKAVEIFETMKSKIGDKIEAIKSKVKTGFDKMKELITNPIKSAKEKFDSIVGKIKNLFPIKFGHLLNFSLPKINVSAGSAPWGIGGKGTKPSFSVSWVSHAAGAVFKRPTLLEGADGWHMVGDRVTSPEAVAPIDILQDYVSNAVQESIPGIDYDLLGEKVAAACARMNITMKVNQRELGRVVRQVT